MTDKALLTTAIQWINAKHRVALVTVVKTWGSSPRPSGSLMLMRDDGQFEGSVSGGCIEQDLLTHFRHNELSLTAPILVDYGVNTQQAAQFGLPCGGRLELLIEPLVQTGQLEKLLERLEAGELVRRQICLETGETSLHRANPEQLFHFNGEVVNQIFGAAWHVILIGAGQLARYTARIALMLDYRITVCDPRVTDWHEEGVQFVTTMPDDTVLKLANHPRAVVITLAHDPKLDDMALMEALKLPCFYIGALGSKRTSATRRKRLLQLDINEQQLNRLHAPVGLDIGSHTPAEIALSIMAGITAARHCRELYNHDSSVKKFSKIDL